MSLIKASHPDNKLTSWKLSPLDRAVSKLVIKGAWVFDAPPDIHLLKETLAQLLNDYQPLAGRLLLKEGVIDLNNEGVSFEAVTGKHQNTEGLLNNKSILKNHVPKVSVSRIQSGKEPLLSVKITAINNKSILGVACSHACMDGYNFYQFLQNWALLCQNKEIVRPSPENNLFDSIEILGSEESQRQALQKNWVKLKPFDLLSLMWSSVRGINKHKSPPIFISNKHIQQLKDQASGLTNTKVGTNAVLSALITKMCFTMNAANPQTEYSIANVVNLRNRLKTLLPNALGNAVITVSTRKFEAGSGYHEIAMIIQRTMEQLIKEGNLVENVQLNLSMMANKLPFAPLDVAGMNGRNPTCIYINNHTRFPVYDIDFGSGYPIHVVPNDLDDMVKLLPVRNKDGAAIVFSGTMAKKYNQIADKEKWLETFLENLISNRNERKNLN